MANRIDSGVQPTAHTAVQAMIVRAQQVADKTGKAIGVHYNLATDELALVEITPDAARETSFIRIAAPAGKAPAERETAAESGAAQDRPDSFKAASTTV